jgi:hypothetical protein
MKKQFLLIAAFLGALTLAGCGGGGGDEPRFATADAVATVTPSTGNNIVGAVINKDFTYSTGVPEFGTTGPTTVTFVTQQSAGLPDNAAPGNPAFKVSSGAQSATGILEYGSCKFRVVSSNFASTHQLGAGKTVTIESCQLVVNVIGVTADSSSVPRNAFLVLNGRRSAAVVVTVQVSPNGQVTVNAFVITTVPTAPATGATGATGASGT